MAAVLPIECTTAGFTVTKLKLSPYDWQIRALEPLERATGPEGSRQNITIRAPNGSGKDSVIIPAAALWWVYYHPKGRVAITTQSGLQLREQTIPSLEACLKEQAFKSWTEPVKSPYWKLTTPEGGSITCFVTNTGERAEGWHKRPDSPLLLIINEAKEIKEDIFRGLDRWTPNAVMMISSPGTRSGRFWESHTKNSSLWTRVKAGLVDCPHIPQERIDFILGNYGKDHPYTQSNLYGEFMDSEEGDLFPITEREILACIESPPSHIRTGFRYGFFDFAPGGRDKNVFVLRDGNKYEIRDAWRDDNEDAIVGRAIALMRDANLSPEQVGGDAAAKGVLDKLAFAGWPIYRQNFGFHDSSAIYTIYRSWSAWAWIEGCHKIKRREVIIPDKPEIIEQLTQRKFHFTVDGKQALEDKTQMFKLRGIHSPDETDALFGAMAAHDLTMFQKSPVFDPYYATRQEHTDILEDMGANAGF